MVGERLKKVRMKNKIMQKELAVILGVTESTISLYETDRSDPSDKIKLEIARYFGVSLDYLIGVVDEEVPYYSDDRFLMLPEDMAKGEKMLLEEFLEFIEFRRSKFIN
ncbi:MAG: helix-turn-helix domain-containing protein [Defluviitaleaceae bacterium]|nr:helix-turn-helix domain-containing protein [Defluviitaleaceae bacterium]